MDQASLPWITFEYPDTLKAVIFEAGAGMCYWLQYQFRPGKAYTNSSDSNIKNVAILLKVGITI